MDHDNQQEQQTATDKFMTVAAHKLNLCQQDGHWSTVVSGWLMPSNGCGCCLAWRGITLGVTIGGTVGLALGAAFVYSF